MDCDIFHNEDEMRKQVRSLTPRSPTACKQQGVGSVLIRGSSGDSIPHVSCQRGVECAVHQTEARLHAVVNTTGRAGDSISYFTRPHVSYTHLGASSAAAIARSKISRAASSSLARKRPNASGSFAKTFTKKQCARHSPTSFSVFVSE